MSRAVRAASTSAGDNKCCAVFAVVGVSRVDTQQIACARNQEQAITTRLVFGVHKPPTEVPYGLCHVCQERPGITPVVLEGGHEQTICAECFTVLDSDYCGMCERHMGTRYVPFILDNKVHHVVAFCEPCWQQWVEDHKP